MKRRNFLSPTPSIVQVELKTFRELAARDVHHDASILAFLRETAGVPENAIVQQRMIDGEVSFGLLVDDDGNLLEFA